jgi:hypothetical protein
MELLYMHFRDNARLGTLVAVELQNVFNVKIRGMRVRKEICIGGTLLPRNSAFHNITAQFVPSCSVLQELRETLRTQAANEFIVQPLESNDNEDSHDKHPSAEWDPNPRIQC